MYLFCVACIMEMTLHNEHVIAKLTYTEVQICHTNTVYCVMSKINIILCSVYVMSKLINFQGLLLMIKSWHVQHLDIK